MLSDRNLITQHDSHKCRRTNASVTKRSCFLGTVCCRNTRDASDNIYHSQEATTDYTVLPQS